MAVPGSLVKHMKSCTGGGCRRTWWENNGSGLDMRRVIEVSQALEKTNSLQLISKKQMLTSAREVEFTQHVLAVHDYNEIICPGQTTKGKWVTSGIWERELKEKLNISRVLDCCSVSYRPFPYSDTFLNSYTAVTTSLFTSWCKSCTQTLPRVTSPVSVELPRGISLQTTRGISEVWAKNGNRWYFHSWCAQLKTSVTLCTETGEERSRCR